MQTKMKIIPAVMAAVLFAVAQGAVAGNATVGQKPTSATSERAVSLTGGEIKKVDMDAGRVTIKHGPLENLGMPGMTMVFGVTDVSVLQSLKTGDKVKFAAGKVDGRIVVTELSVQK